MAHRRFSRGSTPQRRKTAWSEGPFTTVLSPSSSTPVLWSTAQAPTSDGITIARLRGSYEMHISSAASVGDGFSQVGFGIGITTAAAFAAGVASLPTPLTEPGWAGWMYHEVVSGLVSLDTAVPFSNEGSGAHRGTIDSKAMRKIPTDMVVYGCLEAQDEIGAAAMKFTGWTRMLSFLP